MNAGLLRTIIILPGTALVFVPFILVWASGDMVPASVAQARFWIAIAVAAPALGLMIWTVDLFTRFGDGTPAPWDPPNRLVVRGPYRHVRNPMIGGVVVFLGAEALMLWSWPLAAWMAVFLAANAVYFPLSEEKGLERRFGEDYRRYKANVPRWIPRLTPWRDPDRAGRRDA